MLYNWFIVILENENKMGLDLTLIPAYSEDPNNNFFSHDLISLDRDSDLFDEILSLQNEFGRHIKLGGINTYIGSNDGGEPAYGLTERTKYGEVIQSVPAGRLYSCIHRFPEVSLGWKNLAAMGFLANCPAELPIYLYWQ